MIYAFWLFHSFNKNKGYINSWAYERSREEWNKLNNFGKYGSNNLFYGKHHTEETRMILKIKKLGTHLSESAKTKCRDAVVGLKWWNDGEKNVRAKERPDDNWKLGRTFHKRKPPTSETRNKIRNTLKCQSKRSSLTSLMR